MQTRINQISEVTCDLEIEAAAEELAPDFKAALHRQRARTEMKGFRTGKVPVGLVKRIHGEEIAYMLAQEKVQGAFHKEVIEGKQYDVVGRPLLTTLDYEMDGDLRAVIRFGIRPEITLKDLSGEKIPRLKREVTDEDVAENLERIRKSRATLVPVETDEITEDFQVVTDMQRLDDIAGTPVIGEKEEGVTFFVDDKDLHEAIREGVLGKRVGDTFTVELPPDKDDKGPARRYQATVKETKRRDLPDLDDAFAEAATEGKVSDLDAWRGAIRQQLNALWEERTEELLVDRIVDRMMALHDIPIPESAVEMYLDGFVDDVKKRNNGKEPKDFDEQAFREMRRSMAGRHAKWKLLRDAYIEREQLQVTEDDLDAYFDKATGNSDELAPETLRRYYERTGAIDEVRERLMSQKVFADLTDAFEIEDKDPEAFQALLDENASSDSPIVIPA